MSPGALFLPLSFVSLLIAGLTSVPTATLKLPLTGSPVQPISQVPLGTANSYSILFVLFDTF